MSIEIKLKTKDRTMSRVTWYALYRLCRIAARESTKACLDTMIYGTSSIEFGDHIRDGMRHVPLNEVYR